MTIFESKAPQEAILDLPQERITGDILRGRGPRRGNLERLIKYWRPIMRKPGGFRRCLVILANHPELYPLERICAWLHHETTGLWPNEGNHHEGGKLGPIVGQARRFLKKPKRKKRGKRKKKDDGIFLDPDFYSIKSMISEARLFDGVLVQPIAGRQNVVEMKAAMFASRMAEVKAASDDIKFKKVGLVGSGSAAGQALQAAGSILLPGDISDFRSPVRSQIYETLTPGGGRGLPSARRLIRGAGSGARNKYRCPPGFQKGGTFTNKTFSTCGAQVLALPDMGPGSLNADAQRALADLARDASMVRSVGELRSNSNPYAVIRAAQIPFAPKKGSPTRRQISTDLILGRVFDGEEFGPRFVRRDGVILEPMVSEEFLSEMDEFDDMVDGSFVTTYKEGVLGIDSLRTFGTGIRDSYIAIPDTGVVKVSRVGGEISPETRSGTIRAFNAEQSRSPNVIFPLLEFVDSSDGKFSVEFGDITNNKYVPATEETNELVKVQSGNTTKLVPMWVYNTFLSRSAPRRAKNAPIFEMVPDSVKEKSLNSKLASKKSLDAASAHAYNIFIDTKASRFNSALYSADLELKVSLRRGGRRLGASAESLGDVAGGAAAIFDSTLKRYRCPPGTRRGGSFSDKFGTNCGYSLPKNLVNNFINVGQDLANAARSKPFSRPNNPGIKAQTSSLQRVKDTLRSTLEKTEDKIGSGIGRTIAQSRKLRTLTAEERTSLGGEPLRDSLRNLRAFVQTNRDSLSIGDTRKLFKELSDLSSLEAGRITDNPDGDRGIQREISQLMGATLNDLRSIVKVDAPDVDVTPKPSRRRDTTPDAAGLPSIDDILDVDSRKRVKRGKYIPEIGEDAFWADMTDPNSDIDPQRVQDMRKIIADVQIDLANQMNTNMGSARELQLTDRGALQRTRRRRVQTGQAAQSLENLEEAARQFIRDNPENRIFQRRYMDLLELRELQDPSIGDDEFAKQAQSYIRRLAPNRRDTVVRRFLTGREGGLERAQEYGARVEARDSKKGPVSKVRSLLANRRANAVESKRRKIDFRTQYVDPDVLSAPKSKQAVSAQDGVLGTLDIDGDLATDLTSVDWELQGVIEKARNQKDFDLYQGEIAPLLGIERSDWDLGNGNLDAGYEKLREMENSEMLGWARQALGHDSVIAHSDPPFRLSIDGTERTVQKQMRTKITGVSTSRNSTRIDGEVIMELRDVDTGDIVYSRGVRGGHFPSSGKLKLSINHPSNRGSSSLSADLLGVDVRELVGDDNQLVTWASGGYADNLITMGLPYVRGAGIDSVSVGAADMGKAAWPKKGFRSSSSGTISGLNGQMKERSDLFFKARRMQANGEPLGVAERAAIVFFSDDDEIASEIQRMAEFSVGKPANRMPAHHDYMNVLYKRDPERNIVGEGRQDGGFVKNTTIFQAFGDRSWSGLSPDDQEMVSAEYREIFPDAEEAEIRQAFSANDITNKFGSGNLDISYLEVRDENELPDLVQRYRTPTAANVNAFGEPVSADVRTISHSTGSHEVTLLPDGQVPRMAALNQSERSAMSTGIARSLKELEVNEGIEDTDPGLARVIALQDSLNNPETTRFTRDLVNLGSDENVEALRGDVLDLREIADDAGDTEARDSLDALLKALDGDSQGSRIFTSSELTDTDEWLINPSATDRYREEIEADAPRTGRAMRTVEGRYDMQGPTGDLWEEEDLNEEALEVRLGNRLDDVTVSDEDWDGMSIDEAAEALNMPKEEVRERTHAARTRRAMEELGDQEVDIYNNTVPSEAHTVSLSKTELESLEVALVRALDDYPDQDGDDKLTSLLFEVREANVDGEERAVYLGSLENVNEIQDLLDNKANQFIDDDNFNFELEQSVDLLRNAKTDRQLISSSVLDAGEIISDDNDSDELVGLLRTGVGTRAVDTDGPRPNILSAWPDRDDDSTFDSRLAKFREDGDASRFTNSELERVVEEVSMGPPEFRRGRAAREAYTTEERFTDISFEEDDDFNVTTVDGPQSARDLARFLARGTDDDGNEVTEQTLERDRDAVVDPLTERANSLEQVANYSEFQTSGLGMYGQELPELTPDQKENVTPEELIELVPDEMREDLLRGLGDNPTSDDIIRSADNLLTDIDNDIFDINRQWDEVISGDITERRADRLADEVRSGRATRGRDRYGRRERRGRYQAISDRDTDRRPYNAERRARRVREQEEVRTGRASRGTEHVNEGIYAEDDFGKQENIDEFYDQVFRAIEAGDTDFGDLGLDAADFEDELDGYEPDPNAEWSFRTMEAAQRQLSRDIDDITRMLRGESDIAGTDYGFNNYDMEPFGYWGPYGMEGDQGPLGNELVYDLQRLLAVQAYFDLREGRDREAGVGQRRPGDDGFIDLDAPRTGRATRRDGGQSLDELLARVRRDEERDASRRGDAEFARLLDSIEDENNRRGRTGRATRRQQFWDEPVRRDGESDEEFEERLQQWEWMEMEAQDMARRGAMTRGGPPPRRSRFVEERERIDSLAENRGSRFAPPPRRGRYDDVSPTSSPPPPPPRVGRYDDPPPPPGTRPPLRRERSLRDRLSDRFSRRSRRGRTERQDRTPMAGGPPPRGSRFVDDAPTPPPPRRRYDELDDLPEPTREERRLWDLGFNTDPEDMARIDDYKWRDRYRALSDSWRGGNRHSNHMNDDTRDDWLVGTQWYTDEGPILPEPVTFSQWVEDANIREQGTRDALGLSHAVDGDQASPLILTRGFRERKKDLRLRTASDVEKSLDRWSDSELENYLVSLEWNVPAEGERGHGFGILIDRNDPINMTRSEYIDHLEFVRRNLNDRYKYRSGESKDIRYRQERLERGLEPFMEFERGSGGMQEVWDRDNFLRGISYDENGKRVTTRPPKRRDSTTLSSLERWQGMHSIEEGYGGGFDQRMYPRPETVEFMENRKARRKRQLDARKENLERNRAYIERAGSPDRTRYAPPPRRRGRYDDIDEPRTGRASRELYSRNLNATESEIEEQIRQIEDVIENDTFDPEDGGPQWLYDEIMEIDAGYYGSGNLDPGGYYGPGIESQLQESLEGRREELNRLRGIDEPRTGRATRDGDMPEIGDRFRDPSDDELLDISPFRGERLSSRERREERREMLRQRRMDEDIWTRREQGQSVGDIADELGVDVEDVRDAEERFGRSMSRQARGVSARRMIDNAAMSGTPDEPRTRTGRASRRIGRRSGSPADRRRDRATFGLDNPRDEDRIPFLDANLETVDQTELDRRIHATRNAGFSVEEVAERFNLDVPEVQRRHDAYLTRNPEETFVEPRSASPGTDSAIMASIARMADGEFEASDPAALEAWLDGVSDELYVSRSDLGLSGRPGPREINRNFNRMIPRALTAGDRKLMGNPDTDKRNDVTLTRRERIGPAGVARLQQIQKATIDRERFRQTRDHKARLDNDDRIVLRDALEVTGVGEQAQKIRDNWSRAAGPPEAADEMIVRVFDDVGKRRMRPYGQGSTTSFGTRAEIDDLIGRLNDKKEGLDPADVKKVDAAINVLTSMRDSESGTWVRRPDGPKRFGRVYDGADPALWRRHLSEHGFAFDERSLADVSDRELEQMVSDIGIFVDLDVEFPPYSGDTEISGWIDDDHPLQFTYDELIEGINGGDYLDEEEGRWFFSGIPAEDWFDDLESEAVRRGLVNEGELNWGAIDPEPDINPLTSTAKPPSRRERENMRISTAGRRQQRSENMRAGRATRDDSAMPEIGDTFRDQSDEELMDITPDRSPSSSMSLNARERRQERLDAILERREERRRELSEPDVEPTEDDLIDQGIADMVDAQIEDMLMERSGRATRRVPLDEDFPEMDKDRVPKGHRKYRPDPLAEEANWKDYDIYTHEMWRRWRAGDSIEDIAKDWNTTPEDIDWDIRWDMYGTYSDAYKDVNGIRPRWVDWENMTQDELAEMIDELYRD